MNVPAVREALATNAALLPAGRPETSAVNEVIGSPSGSAAVTLIVTGLFSAPEAWAGAVTTGGFAELTTATVTLSSRNVSPGVAGTLSSAWKSSVLPVPVAK